MRELNVLTNGAYFRAQVFHIAYEKTAKELGREPVNDWHSLSDADREHLAAAFQLMLDLELIEFVTRPQARTLRTHGWF